MQNLVLFPLAEHHTLLGGNSLTEILFLLIPQLETASKGEELWDHRDPQIARVHVWNPRRRQIKSLAMC